MGHYVDMDILRALTSAAEKLGHSKLRLLAFKGNDVFMSLHTRSRKWLCYTILPHPLDVCALRSPCLSSLSPLVALMKDLVCSMTERGMTAVLVHESSE